MATLPHALMVDPTPMTRTERMERVRNALVMGGYDPGVNGPNALIEVLVDLICLAAGSSWPFDTAVERARLATGGQPKPAEAPASGAGPTEHWISCPHCALLHPDWAACIPPSPDGKLVRVALDATTGRRAAHVEPWYGRLPDVLVKAEREMNLVRP